MYRAGARRGADARWNQRAAGCRGVATWQFTRSGLGVPFVLSALMLTSFTHFSKRFRPYLPWVERVSGAVLVAAGVMLLTGTYTALNGALIRYTPDWLWSRL